MKYLVINLCCIAALAGCGGNAGNTASTADNAGGDGTTGDQPVAGQDDFGMREGDASGGGVNGSKLTPTTTEAVLKLIVKTETDEPVTGIVVKGVSTDGHKFYTPETDSTGYTEVMVPIGAQFTLTYLSLFQDEVSKQTSIPNEPHVTMKLTLTYTPLKPKPIEAPDDGKLIEQKEYSEPTLILEGVEFDTAKATLRPSSYEHLEPVIEFLTYKPSAMIELSGHTDNEGKPKKNLKLSEDRANAVRDYLISKGIDGNRIIAVGYGQERPIASNDTEAGRQLNRRTEAKEIGK
ncbi:MAG: OmpA family protein [Deltaproteobacteria bacterium]|nr:OmpA family protein [Deltaproteobacteria bacterium]MBN2674067.1 OmpA family protein [Deltaproteobacteria bacterium]